MVVKKKSIDEPLGKEKFLLDQKIRQFEGDVNIIINTDRKKVFSRDSYRNFVHSSVCLHVFIRERERERAASTPSFISSLSSPLLFRLLLPLLPIFLMTNWLALICNPPTLDVCVTVSILDMVCKFNLTFLVVRLNRFQFHILFPNILGSFRIFWNFLDYFRKSPNSVSTDTKN